MVPGPNPVAAEVGEVESNPAGPADVELGAAARRPVCAGAGCWVHRDLSLDTSADCHERWGPFRKNDHRRGSDGALW